MKRRIQVLAALGGIVAALSSTVHAQAAPQVLRVIATADRRSDSNVRWARQRVLENISMLQQDRLSAGGLNVPQRER